MLVGVAALAAVASMVLFLQDGRPYEESMHQTCRHYMAALDAWEDNDARRYYAELSSAHNGSTWAAEEAVGDAAHRREFNALLSGLPNDPRRGPLPVSPGSPEATRTCERYTGLLWRL